MSYWAEEPYKAGASYPDVVMGPLELPHETAYLQHLAAQVALDWGVLAEILEADGIEIPKWLAATMGKLDGVVDDLGELLVYLDANMTPVIATHSPGPDLPPVPEIGHEDLPQGPETATTVAAHPTPPNPEFECTTCHRDAENPVTHEDNYGHWPTYASV